MKKAMNFQLDKTIGTLGINPNENLFASMNKKPIPFDLFSEKSKDIAKKLKKSESSKSVESLYLSDGRMGFHVYNDFFFVICCSYLSIFTDFVLGDKEASDYYSYAYVQNHVNFYSKKEEDFWIFENMASFNASWFNARDFKRDDEDPEKALKQHIMDRKKSSS